VIGANQTSALRDEVVDPAVIVNASIGWQARQDLRLIVGANNLFNKRPEQLNDEAVRFYGFPVGGPTTAGSHPTAWTVGTGMRAPSSAGDAAHRLAP